MCRSATECEYEKQNDIEEAAYQNDKQHLVKAKEHKRIEINAMSNDRAEQKYKTKHHTILHGSTRCATVTAMQSVIAW